MAKSKLCEAAYDGDLSHLVALLKRKAGRVDGMDGDLFDDEVEGCVRGAPYYLPLSEAARAGHEEVVRHLIEQARAEVDGVNYRNETALILAAAEGHMDVVELLLQKGAKIDHLSCLGTALMRAAERGKVAIVDLLLDRGADPNARTEDRGLLEALGFEPEALTRDDDDAREEAERKRRILQLLDKKWRKNKPDALAGLLSAGRAATEDRKKAELGRDAEHEALLQHAGTDAFFDKVAALLPEELEHEGQFKDVERLARGVLTDERAIADEAWGDLVRRVLQLSWSYEDVTLASYGEMLTVDEMDDDEGGAMDYYADEHLYTFDLCLALLSEEAACERDDWSELVEEVCEKKREMIAYMSFGDAEAKALFSKTWVMDHPARDRLKPIARKAFPYAGLD